MPAGIGTATLRWILQIGMHHKIDFALTSFPFIRKPILHRTWQKRLHWLLLSSIIVTRSLHIWKIIIELFKHRFVVQPLQNPPFPKQHLGIYFIQHYTSSVASNNTVSEDAGIEPKNVLATHSSTCKSHEIFFKAQFKKYQKTLNEWLDSQKNYYACNCTVRCTSYKKHNARNVCYLI